jgi:hypothetical protein
MGLNKNAKALPAQTSVGFAKVYRNRARFPSAAG